jgi:DNA repair protein RecO (recombination protein O)
VVALLHQCLPERAPYPAFYAQTEALLDLLEQPEVWPVAYLHWELTLLEEMGVGLDLSRCAVTGATQGLSYVSPRTGRAVTQAGAGDYADRLLPLPPVLRGLAVEDDAQVLEGLRTTGHFLTSRVAPDLKSGALPEARQSLVDRLRIRAGQNLG